MRSEGARRGRPLRQSWPSGVSLILAVMGVACTDRAPPPAFPDPPPPVLAAPIGGDLRHRELGASDTEPPPGSTSDTAPTGGMDDGREAPSQPEAAGNPPGESTPGASAGEGATSSTPPPHERGAR